MSRTAHEGVMAGAARVRTTFRKLVIGRGQQPGERHSVIHRRIENLKAIWENTYEEDAGLEKLVRLFLAASQFLFPGIYIRQLFWRKGRYIEDLAIEVYVLFKTLFPLMVLRSGWYDRPFVLGLVAWLMVETVMYIPTLIFASDAFPSPRSYRRSKLLIFINYLEVVFGFAVIHMAGHYMNRPFEGWTDAVYVSFVVTSTIGFGEYYPVTGLGKLVVSLQSLFYLSYIVLFINVFSFGMKRGYFEQGDKRS